MRDYGEVVSDFSAADLEKKVLRGSLATGVNACVECCDRWAKDGAVALEWYGAAGERKTVTFEQLRTHAYPREIDFVAALPKTPSGKIQRFILRGDAR